MIKIKVFTKEDIEGGYNGTELSYLRPRRYMTGWSFEQLMKYTAEERKWQLFLDPNNLCSLCREHHQKIHDYLNESQLEYVDLDTFVEYDKKEREMYMNNSK